MRSLLTLAAITVFAWTALVLLSGVAVVVFPEQTAWIHLPWVQHPFASSGACVGGK